MRLEDVFEFSQSAEFADYQRHFAMISRYEKDASLSLSPQEVTDLLGWPEIQRLYEKELPLKVSMLESFRQSLDKAAGDYQGAVDGLERTGKLHAFYKSVLENLTSQYLDALSGMLSDVYQQVYQAPNKKVSLSMEDFRNRKVIKLNIVNHLNGRDYLEDFSSEGGAAKVMLGLIVAIYFILVTGAPRIIFIDEALSQLFDVTLKRFLGVLRYFVTSLDFTFCIISHDAIRMEGFVDRVYSVSDGVYSEVPVGGFYESVRSSYGL